jgi:hypothetical protein
MGGGSTDCRGGRPDSSSFRRRPESRAFPVLNGRVDKRSASTAPKMLKPKPSGVARQQVPFFCFAKRKEPKKRRPRFAAATRVPCIVGYDITCCAYESPPQQAAAQRVVSPVRRLRNSRYALRQSSPTSPDRPPLLGGSQGKEIQNRKPGCRATSCPTSRGDRQNNSSPVHRRGIVAKALLVIQLKIYRPFGILFFKYGRDSIRFTA